MIAIEISHAELVVMEKALDEWELAPSRDVLLEVMMDRDAGSRREALDKARDAVVSRKRISCLLRAKLYQASARSSEHPEEAPS